MTPDQKIALQRNILKLVETKAAADLKSAQDHAIGLRQLLDQTMAFTPSPVIEDSATLITMRGEA